MESFFFLWFRSDDLSDYTVGVAQDNDGTNAVELAWFALGLQLVNVRALVDSEAEGGEVPGNGDVAYRLVHQLRAVGILIVERGSRLREIGQRVVSQIGIGPSAASTVVVVGMENLVTL